MKDIKGIKYLPFALLSAAGVLFLTYIFFVANSQQKYIEDNCPAYMPYRSFTESAEFIDCGGSLGIERFSDEDFFTVFNSRYDVDRNWDSFNLRKYKFVEDNLYYLEDSELRLNKGPLYQSVTERPESVAILSRYRKVSTKTSLFTLYKTLDEMPVTERQIFEELDKVSLRQ